MGFLAAARASMRAFVSRAANETTDPASVSWIDAAIGLALLLVAVVATELAPVAVAAPQLIVQLPLLLAISVVVHAVPFAVVVACALWSNQRERLPMLILLVALSMILIQLTVFAMSLAGLRSEAALVGVIAYMAGRATRTMLGFSIVGAIIAGLIVAVGIVAASLLFSVIGA